MKYFTFILTTLLFLNPIFSQTSEDAIFGINKILIEHKLLNSSKVKTIPGAEKQPTSKVFPKADSMTKGDTIFESFLETFKKQIETEIKTNGTLGFGLTLQNSQNQDLSQFKVAANISRGFFPGEFEFNSEINVQVQDGKFIENLSNLSMSYDHHIGNDLTYEGYTFLKRTSNNFLNIDQRYEVGAGLIWNFILSGRNITTKEDNLSNGKQDENIKKLRKRRLTSEGFKKIEAIRAYKPENGKGLSEKPNEKELNLCRDGVCRTEGILLEDSEKTAIKKELKRSVNSILKQESKVRASILAGLNYETERTTDSLKLVFRGDISEKQSFLPVNLVRLVVAPGLELKVDKFSFRSRCYFKLAVSDNDLENIVTADESLQDSKTDYRLEWVNKASLIFSKKIIISAILNYTKMNAPRRNFFIVDGNNQVYSGANRFINFNVQLEYKL